MGLSAPAGLTARRCRAQLLSGPPATDPVDVVDRLLAVQAQDGRGFRLAVRARTTGVTAGDLDRALSVDRSLIVTTLNRGTLHLVGVDDYWWLHALTTPQLETASRRRLTQTGVEPARAELGVRTVTAALAADGPLTRDELRDRLDAAGVPTAGQALVHVLFLTALRGVTVRGPVRDGQQAWVLVADWLGSRPPLDRPGALAMLARRYLAGHGPADERDLARWAGITLGDARSGLRAIAGRLHEIGGGLVDLRRDPAPEFAPPLPGPRLLGAFEPVLLGWRDRTAILGDDTILVTTNGIFRAFAMVGGRAVGSWRMSAGRVTLRSFVPLTKATVRSLTVDAADVAAYLGLPPPELVLEDPPGER